MKRKAHENANLFRELALLLHAGIGPAEGIYLLEEDADLQTMGKVMDGGASLSEAMTASCRFSSFDIGMVRTGEETGRLEEALKALADHYDQQQRTAHMLKTALAYPCTVLALMLVVIGVLLMQVLPVFDSVYASLGSGLTGIAGGLLRLGELLQRALPVILILLLAAAVIGALFTLWGAFREKVTLLWRKKFGDRGILKNFNNARFAHSLSMGLQSGMLPEEAAELAKSLLADVPAASRCEIAAARLKNGADLPDALSAAGFLSPSMARMLAVGLRGGNADTVMAGIAEKMAEEAQQALEDRIAKVEPVLVTAASVLVGAILLAVMLPLMNIMSTIG